MCIPLRSGIRLPDAQPAARDASLFEDAPDHPGVGEHVVVLVFPTLDERGSPHAVATVFRSPAAAVRSSCWPGAVWRTAASMCFRSAGASMVLVSYGHTRDTGPDERHRRDAR
jgi:hypothetical protein